MDWQIIVDSLPMLLEGAKMTVFLTVVSVSIGFCVAITRNRGGNWNDSRPTLT